MLGIVYFGRVDKKITYQVAHRLWVYNKQIAEQVIVLLIKDNETISPQKKSEIQEGEFI